LAQTLEVVLFAHGRITRQCPSRMRLTQKSFCNCESVALNHVTRDSLRRRYAPGRVAERDVTSRV
jgi:hypothetical protein